MILTISLVILALVALNFLLLCFSCNKITKQSKQAKPKVIRNEKPKVASTQLQANPLAPTGS